MNKLLKILEDRNLYLIKIPGLNDKLPDSYKFVTAASSREAISKIVRRIAKDVQDGKIMHRNAHYSDGRFSVVLSPDKAGIIVSYLLRYPNKYSLSIIDRNGKDN